MQGVETNPSVGYPDLQFGTLNQVSVDEGSEYPLPSAFEPWDAIGYYTQLAGGDTAMDPNILEIPSASSGLSHRRDSQSLPFPMDESPIASEETPSTSSTCTQSSPPSITSKEQDTPKMNKRKRVPQSNRTPEKKERVKQRNRVAAHKCRQKKREKVDELKEQSSSLEAENSNLHIEYERLRKEIGQVKSDLMHHTECNDDNINQWISNEAKTYVDKLVQREERQRMGSLSSSNGTIEDVETAQAGLPFGMPSRGNRLG